MRKETIIKYEKEFLAWCKGESVLLGVTDPMHDRTLIWREVRDFNDWEPLDTVYILNDSYSIYRKAMLEGKIVQKQDYFNKQWLDMKTDDFHGASDTRYKGVYRIKPERHKFKKGDWVIHNGVAKRVTKAVDGYIDSLDNEVAVIMKEESLELWEPKEGDLCWFWNKSNIYPRLATFVNKSLGLYYADISNDGFDFCEPYLGKLPSKLKQDSKNISVE